MYSRYIQQVGNYSTAPSSGQWGGASKKDVTPFFGPSDDLQEAVLGGVVGSAVGPGRLVTDIIFRHGGDVQITGRE
jgi:hypothetical protein